MAVGETAVPVAGPRANELNRVIAAAAIGNALEWFDLLVYGYFAVTISKLFFPTADPTTSLLLALGMPFQQEGRPGQKDDEAQAAEEERRHEEARARAEAEQAALEQLKEENPDAYAKPPEPAEGEGEDGEGAADQTSEGDQ